MVSFGGPPARGDGQRTGARFPFGRNRDDSPLGAYAVERWWPMAHWEEVAFAGRPEA